MRSALCSSARGNGEFMGATREVRHPFWATGIDYIVEDVVVIEEATQSITGLVATDSGIGTVVIPLVAHGYDAGDIIYIDGTINYDEQHKLDAATTVNELHFKDKFVTEAAFGALATVLRRRFFKAIVAHLSDITGPPNEAPPANVTDWIEVFSFTGRNVSLIASAAIFNVLQIGGHFRITYFRSSVGLNDTFGTVFASRPIVIIGGYTFVTHGSWNGTVEIQRSEDGGTTFDTMHTYTSTNDRNVIQTFTELEADIQFRVVMTEHTTGQMNWDLTPDVARVSGIVKITAFSNDQLVTADIIETLSNVEATDMWSEGSWSDYRGWPETIAFYEERLVFGGTAHQPLTLWLSKTNDFETMRAGIFDDDSIIFNLASDKINKLQWLQAQESLIIGTSGSEWRLAAARAEDPLTPTNVIARRQSTNGSDNVQGLFIGDSILFVQRTGRKLRELSFQFERVGYISPDITIQSEHITEGGMVETGYAESHSKIYWVVLGNGELLSFTYDPLQEVLAWARHVTDGDFESIAIVPGTDEDQVHVAVNRTINGTTERHIEILQLIGYTDRDDSWFLDDALEFVEVSAEFITFVSNANPGVVTSVGHGLVTDDHVKIVGVDGMTEINDVWKVVKIDDDSYSLKIAGGSTGIDTTSFGTWVVATLPITNITNARETVVTVSSGDFNNDMKVFLQQIVGMTELNNTLFSVFTIDDTSFKIRDVTTNDFIDTTFFNPYVSDGFAPTAALGQKVENTFAGLDHLEAKLVHITGDGAISPSKKVVSGSVTADDYFASAIIGLPYTSILQPMPPDAQSGASQGKKSRITRVGVMLDKSHNFTIGHDLDRLTEEGFLTVTVISDQAEELFTGYKELTFPMGYHDLNPVILSQDKALPLTVLSMIMDLKTNKM